MKVVRFNDYPARPWKNGGGSSRVVAEHPKGARDGDFDWYVALPDIERPGPFSAYPGMDRHLIWLEGRPLALHCRSSADHIDFTHRIGEPLSQFSFRGDWDTHCELSDTSASPSVTRVLNVIARRERVSVKIEMIEISMTLAIEKPPRETLVAVVAGGSLRAMSGGVNVQPPLDRYDAVCASEPIYTSISVSPVGFEAAHLIAIRLTTTR